MPRLKLTRLVLVVIIFTCLTLLTVNVWIEVNNINSYNSHKNNVSSVEEPNLSNNEINKIDLKSTEKSRTVYSDENTESIPIGGNYQLNIREKPWFMANGTKRPIPLKSKLSLWPEESSDDRIVNQLMYLPEGYNNSNSKKLKKILLYFGRNGWSDLPMGQNKFLSDNCPVNSCTLTADQSEATIADAIFFKDRFHWPKHRRSIEQVWILFLLECPLHTQLFRNLGVGVFNWTATYRHDSDIVAPYEKFVSYQSNDPFMAHISQKNYAKGKTKKVAWFVSNCGARNKRLEYARELSRYIEVDIFGSCGNKRCPRNRANECFEMLNKNYKFYLAFENSNCRDYITEKFFVNGLGHNSKDYNLIPIVMGSHPNDYYRSSPHHSYIHVDDFDTPKELAQYLHLLDKNDHLYNKFFDWKSSGEFINTYFWCRVCALLHAPPKPSRYYEDISKWWAPNDVCNNGNDKWKPDND